MSNRMNVEVVIGEKAPKNINMALLVSGRRSGLGRTAENLRQRLRRGGELVL